MTRRNLLAPEVVQTSAMDCGPASLKCLLEGWGLHVSYGRLREACQTDVDGTSIDTIEEVALELGLDAQQFMTPVDHLLLPEAEAIPSIVVVRLPSGAPHFVVLWKRLGPLIQIMDPATGRRWTTCQELLKDVYVHTSLIQAPSWTAFATAPEFLRVLRQRCSRVGLQDEGARLVDAAMAEPGWRGTARLDAAVRMVESIAASGGMPRGARTARLLEHLVSTARDAAEEDEPQVIPEMFWCVRPAPPSPELGECLSLRGAVLITIHGTRNAAGEGVSVPEPRSPELVAALREPEARPGLELLRLVRQGGVLTPSMLATGFVTAAAVMAVLAILFKSMLDVGAKLVLFEQRLGTLAALLAFLVALFLLEVPLALGTQWLGRNLETRLRIAFVQKIPRLGDRYLQSRPMSDMAERSHNSHQIRQLPELAGRFFRQVMEIVLSATGIIWLDPSSAPRALAAALAAVLIPLVLQKPFIERDLRVRSHAGGLTRFYLDSLLGLTAIRTHGAERMVRREHEGLLVEWARAARSLLRTAVMTEVLSTLIALGFATWLFVGALPQMEGMSGTLLLLFWALNIPALGQEIALLARQLPRHRNIALRLLEPLGALEEPRVPEEEARGGEGLAHAEDAPVALRFEDVRVVAAGNTLLSGVELEVAPGEHVAVVGASGAGKSTLVGLVLGWHRASEGRVLMDGQSLSAGRLEGLRRRTAWVEPSVQLWNSSFIDNLTYGSEGLKGLGRVIKAVELQRVLEARPDGLQTSLGEGGALVSGGEGQRVRLGRAMLRPGVRLAVLDEPFRGLDRELRRVLLARSREVWAGVTMLCITHDLAETRGFDRVVVMDEGRIIEDGPPAVLAARKGSRYRALLETEAQVRQELWASTAWRRLRMVDGRAIEEERTA